MSKPGQDEELAEGIEASMKTATEFENAAVQRAIVDSKVATSEDGLVLLRLNRHACAETVKHALEKGPALQECRDRVLSAQCEIRPQWARGAWVLTPMTEEIFAEGMVHPEELSQVHILVVQRDEQAVRDALKEVPRAQRPQLSLAKPKHAQMNDNKHQNSVEAEDSEALFEIVVEHTFITLRRLISKDVDCSSAPARLESGRNWS